MNRKTNRPKCAEGYRYLRDCEIVRGTDEVELDMHLGSPLEHWDVVDTCGHPKGNKVSLHSYTASYRRKVTPKVKPVETPGSRACHFQWASKAKPGKFLGHCAAPMMVRGHSVKVADKGSRFFGATGKVVAVVKNTCRVKYDTPQEKEGYKYSWFWANELENNVTEPKFKVGQKVRVKVPGSCYNDNVAEVIRTPRKNLFSYDVLTTVNGTQLWFKNEELELVEESVNPGEGYRLLNVGEIIQKGDEASREDGRVWFSCEFAIGYDVEALSPGYIYRRKIEAETPTTYRFLKVGEVVLPTDRYVPINNTTDGTNKLVSFENSYLRKVS